jgi:hypothetical protein
LKIKNNVTCFALCVGSLWFLAITSISAKNTLRMICKCVTNTYCVMFGFFLLVFCNTTCFPHRCKHHIHFLTEPQNQTDSPSNKTKNYSGEDNSLHTSYKVVPNRKISLIDIRFRDQVMTSSISLLHTIFVSTLYAGTL